MLRRSSANTSKRRILSSTPTKSHAGAQLWEVQHCVQLHGLHGVRDENPMEVCRNKSCCPCWGVVLCSQSIKKKRQAGQDSGIIETTKHSCSIVKLSVEMWCWIHVGTAVVQCTHLPKSTSCHQWTIFDNLMWLRAVLHLHSHHQIQETNSSLRSCYVQCAKSVANVAILATESCWTMKSFKRMPARKQHNGLAWPRQTRSPRPAENAESLLRPQQVLA